MSEWINVETRMPELKCPACGREYPDKSADEFLLGDTSFCSEDCADKWLGVVAPDVEDGYGGPPL